MKHLMKNASDLREAMEVTEQASSETIQNLELAVAELEQRLSSIQSILMTSSIAPEERIRQALEAR